MKQIIALFVVCMLMTGCIFTRPAQFAWRSNSSQMSTEGKTATITKDSEQNSVNADKNATNESKAVVSGTSAATDNSTDNSTSSQNTTKPEQK